MAIKPATLGMILLTFIGGLLRFNGLGDQPLWGDEGLLTVWVQTGYLNQETIPVLLGYLLNLTHTEFEIRFIYALAGTLTIPAIYYVLPKYKLYAAGLVTVMPLLVFWSQMARPYAVAGLFMVLAWKWRPVMLLAILSTPIALIGFRFRKDLTTAGILVASAVLYFVREDAERNWTPSQMFTGSRWWYLIILTGVLYLFQCGVDKLLKLRESL